MDFELLRGSGRRVLKTRKFQRGGGGGHHKPSGTEILRGWGVKIKKNIRGGGYGYFLELHNDDLATSSKRGYMIKFEVVLNAITYLHVFN